MPESDFLKRLEKYTAIGKKQARDKHYGAEIEPFLLDVATDLSKKFAAKQLYPHVSNFRTHISFRLGPHKKTTHRASVSVRFGDDYIDSGFNLTHALGDGRYLRDLIREKMKRDIDQDLHFLNETYSFPPSIVNR